jgi:hypothetical protein
VAAFLAGRPVPVQDVSLQIPAVSGLLYTPVFVNPTILGALPGYYNSAYGVTATVAPTRRFYVSLGGPTLIRRLRGTERIRLPPGASPVRTCGSHHGWEFLLMVHHEGHSAGSMLSLARPSDSEAQHLKSLPTQCRPYSRLPLCMRFA